MLICKVVTLKHLTRAQDHFLKHWQMHCLFLKGGFVLTWFGRSVQLTWHKSLNKMVCLQACNVWKTVQYNTLFIIATSSKYISAHMFVLQPKTMERSRAAVYLGQRVSRHLKPVHSVQRDCLILRKKFLSPFHFTLVWNHISWFNIKYFSKTF